jgi:predicted transcriptional regulator
MEIDIAHLNSRQITDTMLYSLIGSEEYMIVMPDAVMKQYRLRARLSIAQLARIARIDETTVRRAERGEAVQEVKAYAIAEALSQELGQNLSINDLEIVVYGTN